MKRRHQTMPLGRGLLAGALMVALTLWIGGCAPSSKGTQPEAPPPKLVKPEVSVEVSSLLAQAQGLHQRGQGQQAREVYQKALEAAKNLEERSRAVLGLAQVAESEDAYDEALARLDDLAKITASDPNSPLAVEGEMLAAQLEARLGRMDQSRRRIGNIVPRLLESLRAYEQGMLRDKMEGLVKQGQVYQALSELLVFKADQTVTNDQAAWAHLVARSTGMMPSADGINLAKQTSDQYLKSAVILGLVDAFLSENNPARAQWALDQLRASTQAAQWGPELAQLQEKISQGKGLKENAVGVILPLSGPREEEGRRMLAAIKLALDASLPGTKPITLHAEDSQGDAAGAAEAVSRLVKNSQVMAIIGPSDDLSALAAARRAQQLAIPIITLSKDPAVLEAGSYSFQSCFTDEEELDAVLSKAASLGLFSLATLAPDTARGAHFTNLAKEWVGRQKPGQFAQTNVTNKIKLVRSIAYNPGQKNIDAQLKTLVGLPPGKYMPNHPTAPRPVVDFHGLFIADSPSFAASISPRLAFFQVRKVTLLGTSQWHNPALLASDSKAMDGCLFPDAFNPQSTQPVAVRFKSRFREATGTDPKTPEAMAYDCALVVRKVLDLPQAPRSRSAFRGLLSGLGKVEGACGELSIPPDRRLRTPLTVFTVSRGQVLPAQAVGPGKQQPRSW